MDFQNKHRWLTPKAKTSKSELHGLGVVAVEQIKKSEIITVIGGIVVPRSEILEYRKRFGHIGIQIKEDFWICPIATTPSPCSFDLAAFAFDVNHLCLYLSCKLPICLVGYLLKKLQFFDRRRKLKWNFPKCQILTKSNFLSLVLKNSKYGQRKFGRNR